MPLSILPAFENNFYDSDSDDETESPIISKKNSEFKLTPVCLGPGDPKLKYDQLCNVKVVVEEKEYSHEKGKPHWYYISYEYEFISKKSGKTKKIENSFKHPSNPFFGMPDAVEEYEGTIILKNTMTEKMVEYLLLPIDEISKISGTRCPFEYKRQIMKSIALFW